MRWKKVEGQGDIEDRRGQSSGGLGGGGLPIPMGVGGGGLGLVIVAGNFAGPPAVSAALAYGIVEVLGSLVVALWWARRKAAVGH